MTTVTITIDDPNGLDSNLLFPSASPYIASGAGTSSDTSGSVYFRHAVNGVAVDPRYAVSMTGNGIGLTSGSIDVHGNAAAMKLNLVTSGGALGAQLMHVDIALDGVWLTGYGGVSMPSVRSLTVDVLMGHVMQRTSANLVLVGNTGNDTLHGSFLDDTLRGGAGADRLIGGAGNDTATYESSNAGVRVNLLTGAASGGHAAGDTLSSIENVIGTDFADTLTGNAANNFIDGLFGFDIIDGGAGDDFIFGRAGGGVLRGGAGNDRVDGGVENDTIHGGAGNDELRVGDGTNSAYGEAGDDILLGASGSDWLDGGTGADTLLGEGGTDTASYAGAAARVKAALDGSFVFAGEALGDRFFSIERLVGSKFADVLRGDGNANRLSGNDGNDTLHGGAGNDELRVGAGTNSAYGEAGNDTLLGASGSDLLAGGAGADTLRGEGGIDTASYAGAAARVKAALDGSFVFAGEALGDRFFSIERLVGSKFGDVLRGDGNANRLSGNGGNDTLQGMAGNDTVHGGAGADALSGGLGNDRFEYTTLGQGGDTIMDFRNLAGDNDGLRFSAAVFGKLPDGALAAGRFRADATGVAGDANDRFIYETDTGILRFDLNGTGAGGVTLIATLTGTPALMAADITIF